MKVRASHACIHFSVMWTTVEYLFARRIQFYYFEMRGSYYLVLVFVCVYSVLYGIYLG